MSDEGDRIFDFRRHLFFPPLLVPNQSGVPSNEVSLVYAIRTVEEVSVDVGTSDLHSSYLIGSPLAGSKTYRPLQIDAMPAAPD